MLRYFGLKLLALFIYYSAYQNYNDAILEVANFVNGGYYVFYSKMTEFENQLLEDPANVPVTDAAENEVFPRVTLPSGAVIKGRQYSKTTTFHNIPYAEPPIGNLRFRDPVSFIYPDFIDASQFNRLSCPQYCYPPFCEGEVSEDCLKLTVQVPSNYTYSTTNLLPVMIWVHGGAFMMGSSNDKIYNMENLSNATNTVIVSMNYRLGYLGFLTMEEEGITGNQGLKDQRLAMKWVRDNIHAFGGDKDQVTLFGESAGGESVEFHLLSEASKPYFNRAIVQSTPNYPYPDKKDANMVTDLIVTQFILRSKCGILQRGIDCLRDLPYEDFLELIDTTKNSTLTFLGAKSAYAPSRWDSNYMSFIIQITPMIDGDDIKDEPSVLFKTGRWNTDKDVMIGHTDGEMNIMQVMGVPIDLQRMKELSSVIYGEKLGSLVVEKYGQTDDVDDYNSILGDSQTQSLFSCYARAIARHMVNTSSSGGKVYFYQFSQPSSAIDISSGELFLADKALHQGELEYLFNIPFLGNTRYRFSGDEELVRKMMVDYWGSFARDGVPTSNQFTPWPQYQQNNGRWPSLEIKAPDARVVDHLNEDICDFWDQAGLWST